MKLNQLILIALLITVSQKGFTQTNKRNEYFVTSTDTVFCTGITYGIINNSKITSIEYTNMKGESVEIKGKQNISDILVIYQNGNTKEKIQLEPDRPQGPFRLLNRALDGKIKVYHANVAVSYGTFSSNGGGGSKSYFKTPDGVAYEYNKKNCVAILKPLMLLCKEFENKYGGDVNNIYKKSWEMINFYNDSCK